MDEIESIVLLLDPKFPLDDVEAIGARLAASGGLIAGYIPPVAGVLSIVGLQYAQVIQQVETRFLPDRNLASRIARLARDGARHPLDGPTALAADLMAFAQAMNLQFEPSIAFHELAHREGNAVAQEELCWFRAADHSQATAWIDLAQRRIDKLPIAKPKPRQELDLAFPLRRWSRNYIVALKIAELELADMQPLKRAMELFKWMIDDFIMAGPAAIFATMYFSPRAAKRRLVKHLRSVLRERAIAGIKNAAWDITHLSNFVAEAQRSEISGVNFIFATADRGLAEIAPVLMTDAGEDHDPRTLQRDLSVWWPNQDAKKIADTLFDHLRTIRGRTPPSHSSNSNDPIKDLIDAGEAKIRKFVGKTIK